MGKALLVVPAAALASMLLSACGSPGGTFAAYEPADAASERSDETRAFQADAFNCHTPQWQKKRETEGRPCSEFLKVERSRWDTTKITAEFRLRWRDRDGNWIGSREKYKERWGDD